MKRYIIFNSTLEGFTPHEWYPIESQIKDDYHVINNEEVDMLVPITEKSIFQVINIHKNK